MESRPRSDVRGERADLIHERHGRSREIEDAIRGGDLVGVRDALVGLRSTYAVWVLENVGQELDRERRSLGEHRAGVVVRLDLERSLRGDRPGIELLARAR